MPDSREKLSSKLNIGPRAYNRVLLAIGYSEGNDNKKSIALEYYAAEDKKWKLLKTINCLNCPEDLHMVLNEHLYVVGMKVSIVFIFLIFLY